MYELNILAYWWKVLHSVMLLHYYTIKAYYKNIRLGNYAQLY